MKLIFDIETNGLLDELTTIHSLVIRNYDTEEVFSYTPDNIEEGVRLLQEADEIIGHNIIKFDIPAIKKVYPWFVPKGKATDTLILARLFWPELMELDAGLVKRGILPKRLTGRYSLDAFGYRLNEWKGDYSDVMKEHGLDPWAAWNEEMQRYCEQDVVVTTKLYSKCLIIQAGEDKKGKGIAYSEQSIRLEMQVAEIIARQERHGFAFDVRKAEQFYLLLIKEREELAEKLKNIFGAWWAPVDYVDVKRTRKVKRKDLPPVGEKQNRKGIIEPVFVLEHYYEGSCHTKIKRVEFNPSSNQHIANRLKILRGWKPTEFTPSGEVKVDETILSKLPYPETELLTRYLMVAKRIAQLAEGNQAWLKKEKNERIHGSVITVGAVTRRMTHNNPNVAQVPKVGSPYGAECRELFTASKDNVLVGCDADALELRCLAGYMAAYDEGDYIKTVLSGDKALGTDMHSVNARALGLDPKLTYPVDGRQLSGRDIAKTWFYAFIYGAGDYKLGTVMGVTGSQKTICKTGKESRERFLAGLPALGKLVKAVQNRAFGYSRFAKLPDGRKQLQKVEGRGFVIGLDGGKIKVRHKHSALNTLLQSAGAIIMKKALVILDEDLQHSGMKPTIDYEFSANIHDEWQIDCRPEVAEQIAHIAEDAIKKAGEAFNFACPLAGNADIGKNWKETH